MWACYAVLVCDVLLPLHRSTLHLFTLCRLPLRRFGVPRS